MTTVVVAAADNDHVIIEKVTIVAFRIKNEKRFRVVSNHDQCQIPRKMPRKRRNPKYNGKFRGSAQNSTLHEKLVLYFPIVWIICVVCSVK